MSIRFLTRDHLVFDLDGTISDPAVGILRSINYALASFGYSEITRSEISAYIGPPIDLIFGILTGSESKEHILTLVARFRERYADIGYSENQLYPGVMESLNALISRGAKLGLCTSKRADLAEKVLTMFGLRSHFEFVSGGDVGISKSDQLHGLVVEGIVGAGSLMIGDRAVDVLAARSNMLGAIGVLWGHGSSAELVDAGADQLLSSTSELCGLVNAR